MEEGDALELVGRVETLLAELEALPDSAARDSATEVVQALLDLYGAGLERIVEVVAQRDEDGGLARALADDELAAHLLLLHGLHPVPLEQRVRSALADVRPYLESHGGNVELLAIDGDTVRLALQGSCSGCPSSTMTLKLAIENAIRKAAPEIEQIEADGAVAAAAPALLQIELAAPAGSPGSPGSPADADWAMAGGLPDLVSGHVLVKPITGQRVLFLRLNGRLYGYRPECPACEESLDGATLSGAELSCPGCAQRFDVLRAGRCLDAPQLHLEPVPLLVDADGLVKVALATPA